MNAKAKMGTIIGLLCLGLGLSVSEANIATANPLPKARNLTVVPSFSGFGSASNLVASKNPNLACAGSGELSGPFPGWSSDSAVQITLVKVAKSVYGVYWCPASAPSGQGVITYTVTASSGSASCVTTNTFCEISGITGHTKLMAMATDQTGSYRSGVSAFQNNGMIEPCQSGASTCNASQANLAFSTFGNDSVGGLQDCTFAAVADWEKIVLGKAPDATQIKSEFISADPLNDGLTNDALFSYWRNNGIGSTFLKTAVTLHTDPLSLVQAVNDPTIKAPIVELHFSKGQNFAGIQFQEEFYHWVVVDGYTLTGPLVATWGQTLQMTWQQWNLEVAAMWGVSVSM